MLRCVSYSESIIKFFCNVAVKPLATIYIVFALTFICEASNNLFPVVVCDFKTSRSADPTMNANLCCMLFAAIEVNT